MKKLLLTVATITLLATPAVARATPDCNELDQRHERIRECVIERSAETDDEPFSFLLASAGVAVAVGAVVAFVLLRRGAELPTPHEDAAEASLDAGVAPVDGDTDDDGGPDAHDRA